MENSTSVQRPTSPMLHMQRIRGEVAIEEVFFRTFKNFDFYLKHETPTSRWEWIIMEGNVPVAFDDEPTFAEAESALARAAFAEVPGFEPHTANVADVIDADANVYADEDADEDIEVTQHTQHTRQRRKELLNRARGLLCLLSLAMVTGARIRLAWLERKLINATAPPQ